MVGYWVTIYAASGKVWVMADWEQRDGRHVRLVDWYDLEAGRSAQTSLLALKLSVVARQVAVYAYGPAPVPCGISRLTLAGPQDWMNGADQACVDAIMACIKAGGIAIRRREGGLPSAGSG